MATSCNDCFYFNSYECEFGMPFHSIFGEKECDTYKEYQPPTLEEEIPFSSISVLIYVSAVSIRDYYLEYSPDKKHPLVLLGRDCWIFIPMLEKMGLPVQYFLYSRLQIGDKGTQRQWLKEVGSNALVVDTGYFGTIFKDIEKFDPSIKGALLCSMGDYPHLLNDHRYDHEDVVRDIEKLPKIIGRCVAIDENGLARCPQDTRDLDERGDGLPVEVIVEWNRGLMEHMGFDPRRGEFTGITPESRIPEGRSLKSHYKLVAKSRKGSKLKKHKMSSLGGESKQSTTSTVEGFKLKSAGFKTY